MEEKSEYEYDDLGRVSKVSHPMFDNGSITDNLIYLESKELSELSSALGYIAKYEYY